MPAKSDAALARKREYLRNYNRSRPNRQSGKRVPSAPRPRLIVGIDGEGWGSNPHRYTMLSWADSLGRSDTLTGERLTTGECLRFLREGLPQSALCFMFAYGYDLTKILQDLDNKSLYELEHPEARDWIDPKKPQRGRWPVRWGAWRLEKQGTRFRFRLKNDKYWRTIWDVFKFFGTSFVKAVGPEGWNVASPAELKLLAPMKARRSKFSARDRKSIQEYNELECRLLVELMQKVRQSFSDLDLRVKAYFGPGSVAAAMYGQMQPPSFFKMMKARWRKSSEPFKHAVMSAYFGGRFETRVIGEFDKVWEYDICSAYPAEIAKLPCLLHGRWRRKGFAQKNEGLALIRYTNETPDPNMPWGALPFRHDDGSISFPAQSGGGWIWSDEFDAACNLFSLGFAECWVYEKKCKCPPPFAAVSQWYERRMHVGKNTGPGLTIKLGINSLYGKAAQSIGNAPFQSWIYAGLITAGTRAQILRAIAAHKNPRNVLSIATDGILSLEPNLFPDTKKLGEWEAGPCKGKQWIVRPGIVIGSKIRARGIGAEALKSLRGAIDKEWNKHHDVSAHVQAKSVSRFIGLKQGVWLAGDRYKRSENYGEWIERPQVLAFDPMPKREGLEPGSTTDLQVRRLPMTEVSAPYDRTKESEDAKTLIKQRLEDDDQPDREDPEEAYQ